MDKCSKVLSYWFGNDPDDLAVIRQKSSLWFGKDRQIDHDIRQRFGHLLDLVDAGPSATVRQRLADIVLLDQFSRNIYRGQAKAFSYDPLALQMVLDGLASGEDQQLRPVERVFYYLPLEHSEVLENQQRCVVLYQKLLEEVVVEWKEAFAGFVDYAVRHKVIIERFGRFPHRNAILGRSSTAEELDFLQQPGSSF